MFSIAVTSIVMLIMMNISKPYVFLTTDLSNVASLYVCFFQTPTSGLNGPLLGYKVIYAPIPGNDTEKYVSGGQTSYTIANIDEWTLYRIKVKCYNYKGDGPASADVIERTLEGGTYIFSVLLVVV
jgi:hypothetical protein